MNTLNESQYNAVMYNSGPSLIIAGAGSGKTRVLTYKVAQLIREGYAPNSILVLTFTNKAAKEMRERVEVKLDGGADSIFIGTFHSFGLRILRENYADIGYTSNITILDTDDSKALIKRILKENEYDPKDYDIKTIISKISSAKNDGISPEEYKKLYLREEDQVIGLVYEKYLKLLKENNSVDFDDLLLLPIELFKKNPEILEKYQDLYQYILIDEYQDTNEAQYILTKLLCAKNRRITCVGDDSQSIYSFRGANYKNILKEKVL